MSPRSEFTTCAEYDVQSASAPGQFDHVNSFVEPYRGFVEVALSDAGEGQIAEHDGL
jgi:hypothetical protein